MWYLIGACIGDGNWSNSTEAIGTSIYPMSVVKDYEYDPKTGKGELTFTGYLTTEGFKLIKTPGGWDDQWGMSDGNPVKNDGGSGNIVVEANGYYTVKLDTKNDKLTIEKAEITPTVYPSICMSGDFNEWSDTPMTAVNTVEGVTNHIWSYILETPEGSNVKFKIPASWDSNWGNSAFPYGIGSLNGDNIPVAAGKYIVVFNDIDGSYTFTAIE